jgi:hypothetical protein
MLGLQSFFDPSNARRSNSRYWVFQQICIAKKSGLPLAVQILEIALFQDVNMAFLKG